MTKNYRRCVSCRKNAPKSEFWKVVRCHSSNEITIDLGNKFVQGRSAYLCQQVDCLQLAQKKNRLSRSLKAAVCGDIYQRLAALASANINNE
jgi:uncharacterized protein